MVPLWVTFTPNNINLEKFSRYTVGIRWKSFKTTNAKLESVETHDLLRITNLSTGPLFSGEGCQVFSWKIAVVEGLRPVAKIVFKRNASL